MSIIDEWLILCKAQVEGSGFQKLNKQITSTKNNLFDAKNLFRAFIGYDIYSGLKAFGSNLIQSSKDLGAMTSRFYAITKSEELANKELQWTFDLAKRTAMPIKEVADSYSIFYSATQKGLGTEGARQVFQDWTEVSRVLHMSTYQFERVTYALREMASKGAIYSQDLRMQIGTHVPDALGIAEKAVNELGISGNDWFDKFQKQAKGNQKLINQFIVLFSKYAKEAYASPEALRKSLQQTDSVINALSNTWQLFQYNLTKAGFTKDLIKDVRFLNSLLEKITQHAPAIYKIAKTLAILFGIILGGKAIGATVKVIKNLTTFLSLLKWVKSMKDLAMLGQIISGIKGLTTIGRVLPFLSILLPILSNPIALGVLLIAGCVPLLDWFLKKFFPNVWIAIHMMLHRIALWFRREFGWIQSIFANQTPDAVQKADEEILAKRQQKREQGGLLRGQGIKAILKELWSDFKIPETQKMTTSELARLGATPFGGAGLGSALVQKHQIDITVNNKNVANNIQSEDLKQAMQDNQQSIWSKILGGVKPNK